MLRAEESGDWMDHQDNGINQDFTEKMECGHPSQVLCQKLYIILGGKDAKKDK